MRFKRGSKVEVIIDREVPISWREAEILSGNGHTYLVRYDSFPLLGMTNGVPAERVSRKRIRPCPPLVQGVENLVAGDIVEVFYNFSWKIASILKVFSGDQYLVRLLGCSLEFYVQRSNIRLRQCWQDGKWMLMRKGSGVRGFKKSNSLSTSKFHLKISSWMPLSDTVGRSQAPLPAVQSSAGFEESPIVSLRSLKRTSPYSSSIIQSPNKQKIRVIEKGSRRERVIAVPVSEKVDAVVYPGEILAEKCKHASYNNKLCGCFELVRENINRDIGCSSARSSEPSGYDSEASSVGSCSINDISQNMFHSGCVPFLCQVTDSLCSDAESFYGSEDGEESYPHSPEDKVTESIHKLELNAYRCTLQALYASGPLSWEQEALLTNLRIKLHISNDEHLMELKNLLSAKHNSYVR